ncbi:MAG: DUF2829 domain-containing protein [Oscillospiraceae bacterium]
MQKNKKWIYNGLLILIVLVSSPLMTLHILRNGVRAYVPPIDETATEPQETSENVSDNEKNQVDSSASLDFGKAVEALKENHKITRASWNNPDKWVELVTDDTGGTYLQIHHEDGQQVPWMGNEEDLLAEDWLILESE